MNNTKTLIHNSGPYCDPIRLLSINQKYIERAAVDNFNLFYICYIFRFFYCSSAKCNKPPIVLS